MLLSLSPLNCGDLKGMLLILHRQWTSSAATQSEEIVSVYAESLFRMLSDTESTKPYLAKLGSPVLSDLEAASEICLRRLPERFRKGCSIFAVVQDRRATKPRVHYKLPEWTHLSLMNETRDVFEMKDHGSAWKTFDAADPKHSSGTWKEMLVNFFAPPSGETLLRCQQSLPAGITHYRVAELIQRSSLPALAPAYSLTLASGKNA
jgi:hypothetical protein